VKMADMASPSRRTSSELATTGHLARRPVPRVARKPSMPGPASARHLTYRQAEPPYREPGVRGCWSVQRVVAEDRAWPIAGHDLCETWMPGTSA
jgi:hypothetical protein